MLQRPGSVAVFLAVLTLLVGSEVAQAQSTPGPPKPDPSPAAVKHTQAAATPTPSRQSTPSPAPAASRPVATVTQAPTPTHVPAASATPSAPATKPAVHHKAKAAVAKPAARPPKRRVKKAQPKVVTKKPVVKASRPVVKLPVAPVTPASSPSQSVNAHGGFWSTPLVVLLVSLAVAFLLVAGGGAMVALWRRTVARRRWRRVMRDVAPWPPELPLESRDAQKRRSLPRPVTHRREAQATEDSHEWQEIQDRLTSIRAISLSGGAPRIKKPVSVETEEPASLERAPSTDT